MELSKPPSDAQTQHPLEASLGPTVMSLLVLSVNHLHWTKQLNKQVHLYFWDKTGELFKQEIWPWPQQIKLTDASSVIKLTCTIKFKLRMLLATVLDANSSIHRATLPL
jgi:hypothetical protein